MNIAPNIEIIGKSLLIENNLIISDIHIGYEESLNKKGVFVPRNHFDDILDEIKKILREAGKIDSIIINGDLKHEFGKISDTEWRHTLRFIDFLAKNCNKIILIKGNHDKILEPIAKKRKVEIKEKQRIKDVLIVHGDKLIEEKGIKTIIIGHEHPAITLKEGPRQEKFKCFLKGKYKRKALIVMPSFNPLLEGTDMLDNSFLSPYLEQDISGFEVYIVSDKVYYFGKIEDMRD